MNFKFIHTSDLHFDAPFSGFSGDDPHLTHLLRDASLKSFENLVTFAIQEKIDFIVIAGDIYDGDLRGVRAQFYFYELCKKLNENNIHVYIVFGNHDPLIKNLAAEWSGIKSWPENIHFFHSENVETLIFQKNGIPICKISGLSYKEKEVGENLVKKFPHHQDSIFHIAILHCNLNGKSGYKNYSPCKTFDLVEKKINYWALGHIHENEVVKQDNVTIAYSGTIQGRSFKTSEIGNKGAYLVSIENNHLNDITFKKFSSLNFEKIKLQISHEETLEAIYEKLIVQLNILKDQNQIFLVNFTLTGKNIGTPILDEWLIQLRDKFWRQNREGIWVNKIKNKPEFNLDQSFIEQNPILKSYVKTMAELKNKTPEDLVNYINKENILDRNLFKHLFELDENDWREVLDKSYSLGLLLNNWNQETDAKD